MMDSDTRQSKGYGFITVSVFVFTRFTVNDWSPLACPFTHSASLWLFVHQFADAECAKKALDQLNGFELAGRPMKVGNVTERTDAFASFLDSDELERSGIDLGTTGRLQLMARLAEGETPDTACPTATSACSIHLQSVCVCVCVWSPSGRYWSTDASRRSAGSADERRDRHGSHGCRVRYSHVHLCLHGNLERCQ